MAMSKQGKQNMDVLITVGEMLYNQGSLDSLVLFRRFLDKQEEEANIAWTVDLIKDTLDALIKEKSENTEETETPVKPEPITIDFGEQGLPIGSFQVNNKSEENAMNDIGAAFGGLLGNLFNNMGTENNTVVEENEVEESETVVDMEEKSEEE